MKIAVIDFETTGIENAEVLQAAIIDGNGQPLLNNLYCPERVTAWPDAERVHGISPADVQGRLPFRYVIPQVTEILNAADFVLAYNAAFELRILAEYGVRHRHTSFVDPMLMFAGVYGEWNSYYGNYRWQKLTTAANYYGYDFDAHDALADVKATLYIFKRMIADGVTAIQVPAPRAA